MEIRMGGGSLNLDILRRGGAHAVSQFKVERGGKKRAFHHGGVDFFWNNPKQTYIYFQSSLPSTHYSLLFSWREVVAGNRSTLIAGYQKMLPFRKKLIQSSMSFKKAWVTLFRKINYLYN